MTDHIVEANKKVIDLDALEKMADEATPGPWEQSHREGDDEMYRTQVYTADGETIASLAWYPKDMGGGRIGTYREANAAFMAAANPATIKTLIAELRDARSTVEELLYAHTDKSIAMGRAFLARNGKGEG